MTELKPCPFCGGKARFTTKRIAGSTRYSFEKERLVARWRVRVMCNKCRTLGSSANTELLIQPEWIVYGIDGEIRIDEKAIPAFSKAAEKWNRRAEQ